MSDTGSLIGALRRCGCGRLFVLEPKPTAAIAAVAECQCGRQTWLVTQRV